LQLLLIYAPENKFLSENEKGNNSYNTEGRDFLAVIFDPLTLTFDPLTSK